MIEAKVLASSLVGHSCEGNGRVTGNCHMTKHFASADAASIWAQCCWLFWNPKTADGGMAHAHCM